MLTDKLRVLMILRGLDIGNIDGGRERFGIALCRELRDSVDLSVCVFCRRGSAVEAYWYNGLREDGIDVFFATGRQDKCGLAQLVHGVCSILRRCSSKPPDIIHSQYQQGTVVAMLLKLSRRSCAILRTVHTSSLARGEWGNGPVAWILRQVFTNCLFPWLLDAEVGISRAAVMELGERRWGSRLIDKHVPLIYNAIDPEAYQYGAEGDELACLPKDKLVIGSIGRLTKQKGYLYLIEAMPRILAEMPNVLLLLVGDGELHEGLQQRAQELGIRDRILFAGQQENTVPFLRQMCLFVLPSLWEGLPTAVLESMACSVPVVASNIPGTQELIQDGLTGWLVRPQDPDQLCNAIIKVLKTPDLRAQVAENALRFSRGFSMRAVARQYVMLYEDCSQRRAVTGRGKD